ncbi:MAG: Alpha-D-glucose-1-phosphate phosphatase YihX [Chloroflexi bacterium ADurb.Bin325]|nr:MAG: Alpha-D-glucose-1-phosphate phosphatase YihX [Chloroflexi bacterium ADurb.Bin325]
MPMKAVIFDFGGVLVRTRDQSLRASWEQRLGLAPGEASTLVFEGERGRAAQHGWISDADHWRWIGQRLAIDDATLAQFRADFFRRDVLDLALIAYIDRLRAAGYHLGLLSNATDAARRSFTETYPVLPHFDSVTISAEEGLMKPDPRIFRVALARAGVQPHEAAFVDDVAENVAGARALGMVGVHFRDPAAAIAELAGLTGVT